MIKPGPTWALGRTPRIDEVLPLFGEMAGTSGARDVPARSSPKRTRVKKLTKPIERCAPGRPMQLGFAGASITKKGPIGAMLCTMRCCNPPRGWPVYRNAPAQRICFSAARRTEHQTCAHVTAAPLKNKNVESVRFYKQVTPYGGYTTSATSLHRRARRSSNPNNNPSETNQSENPNRGGIGRGRPELR